MSTEARFQFPEEIRDLFRYMVEEPLGWPNGEAGDFFLATLEGAVQAANLPDRNAFGGENHPHIAPHHLLAFGVQWAAHGLGRAKENDEILRNEFRFFDLEATAKNLRMLADTADKLSARKKELGIA